MRAPELKPCPFCGGKASEGRDGEYFLARCINCSAETHSELRRVAVSSWNRRADLAAADAAKLAAIRAFIAGQTRHNCGLVRKLREMLGNG